VWDGKDYRDDEDTESHPAILARSGTRRV
jgi:hypothetical protein